MNFTKRMIELVFEIRKLSPAAIKKSVKLTNPELLLELKRFYYGDASLDVQALIKELFHLAGDKSLEAPGSKNQSQLNVSGAAHLSQKLFQGAKVELAGTERKKAKKIYRGQVVEY